VGGLAVVVNHDIAEQLGFHNIERALLDLSADLNKILTQDCKQKERRAKRDGVEDVSRRPAWLDTLPDQAHSQHIKYEQEIGCAQLVIEVCFA
jgi:hypothetical protein